MFVSCECCVLSGRGLCVGMIMVMVPWQKNISLYNRPPRPRGGVDVYLYAFFNLGARWGGGESTPRGPAVLFPGMIRYPLYRRLGGPQRRSERVRKISPPLGFDPWTIQSVASR